MKVQWECIRENIGTWQGSFTQFSPEGVQIKDTPSILTLEETELEQKMKLTLERTPPDGSTDITRREFSAPGPAPYVYFFENGAFSQGSAQWSAFGQFGAEMSLKAGDRRLRFVIMYDGTSREASQLKYVTLIRERQKGGTQFTEPNTTIEQLQGDWKGTSSVLHATMEPMTEGRSKWSLDSSVLECVDTFEQRIESVHLSVDDAMTTQNRFFDLKEDLIYRLMMLPNGAYCLLPFVIEKNIYFRIEVGWMSADGGRSHSPSVGRSRLVRYYDNRGIWTDSAFIEDSYEGK